MKKNRNLIFENIPRKLYEKPQLLDVDRVVIENQPCLKNPQMKSIQLILYSYFLILGKVIGNGDKNIGYIDKVDFCSASNKLKIYDGPKIILEEKNKKKKKVNTDLQEKVNTDLQEKVNTDLHATIDIDQNIKIVDKSKKTTIKYADKKRLAIEHTKYFLEKDEKYKDFFNNHKKKDDLADSYLQGLYYIKNMKK
jgi:hypothetical protein